VLIVIRLLIQGARLMPWSFYGALVYVCWVINIITNYMLSDTSVVLRCEVWLVGYLVYRIVSRLLLSLVIA